MEKNLGYLISFKRKQLNISQRELAKQTGIANSTISRIEKSIVLINIESRKIFHL